MVYVRDGPFQTKAQQTPGAIVGLAGARKMERWADVSGWRFCDQTIHGGGAGTDQKEGTV
jgi:hypothetical protein